MSFCRRVSSSASKSAHNLRKAQLKTARAMSEHKYDLDSDAEQNYSLNSHTGVVDLKSVPELTTHIQSVLQNMQDKFLAMSNQINNQMEDMGTRVDDLEKTIGDVMTQAGMELTL